MKELEKRAEELQSPAVPASAEEEGGGGGEDESEEEKRERVRRELEKVGCFFDSRCKRNYVCFTFVVLVIRVAGEGAGGAEGDGEANV